MANRHMKSNTETSVIGWLVLVEEGAVDEDEDEDEDVDVEGVYMGSFASFRYIKEEAFGQGVVKKLTYLGLCGCYSVCSSHYNGRSGGLYWETFCRIKFSKLVFNLTIAIRRHIDSIPILYYRAENFPFFYSDVILMGAPYHKSKGKLQKSS